MLNKEQKQAVKLTEGPIRIIAGVGTGKTFTLINRISNLIKKKKIPPYRILALTFTNKASRELKERLEKMKHFNVNVMTFHSLAAHLLRKFWNNEFKIIDAKEQADLLNAILNDNEKDFLKDIVNDLDLLRQNKFLKKLSPIISDLTKERLEEILKKYEKILSEKNYLDFGSLIVGLEWLWEDHKNILEKCQTLYDYILVDEYQDVNEIQVEFLRKLAESHKNICVVGDCDQTIYSWRGAKASTLKEFEEIFPNAATIILKQNYRNPPAILKGAQALIANNPDRFEKNLEALSDEKGVINLWECNDEFHENEIFYSLLEKYLGSTSDMYMADYLDNESESRSLSDIAFLYRTQEQGKILAELLSKKGYPYQISSSKYYWQEPEIQNFIAAMELISNSETIKKFSDFISEQIDLFIAKNDFSKIQINRLKHLMNYSIGFTENNLKEALQKFLDEIKTHQEADNLVYGDRINLLTLHAAKGLEFPIVIIWGLEDGLIPNKKSRDDPYFYAEERRLLYVGMTRAKQELHLLFNRKNKPSPFLVEIGFENMLIQNLPEKKLHGLKRKAFKEAQMTLF